MIYTVIRSNFGQLYGVFFIFRPVYNIMAEAMQRVHASMAAPAASALQSTIAMIVPHIRTIIEACKQKTAGIMQPSVDEIVKMCLQSGLAVRRNVLARNIGIHPSNRACTGVDPVHAQNLTLQISKQGYSETKLEQPMGFEKAQDGALRDEQEAFNEKMFAESGGYLKAIPFRDIEYLPVTCSHTFAALNIIERGRAWAARRIVQ